MSDDISSVSPSSAGEHGVLRSMQEVAMSSQEASKMLRTYNIAWWGNNYYDVNELGHISVCPDPDVPEARVDLAELVKAREAQGQRLPALFCFPQILQHRLRSINAAFKRGVNRTQAVLQNLREAEQCRQALPLRFACFH